MSERVKGKDEIRADPAAFKSSLQRAREAFGRIEGVLSVGAGQKESAGEYRDAIAIVVVVREKKPLEMLARRDRIPPTFEGYPTDVTVVGKGTPLGCANEVPSAVIQGGIQICASNQTGGFLTLVGTLGCIVRHRGDQSRENVYILSNRHILYANGADDGDYVYHPKAFPEKPSRPLGPIQPVAIDGNVPYTPPGDTAEQQFFIDCATARLDIDSKCYEGSTCTQDTTKYDASVIELEVGNDNPETAKDDRYMIADVRSVIDDETIVTQQVFKVGRTTRKTAGIVRLIADSFESGGEEFKTMIKIDFDTSTPAGATNCDGNERFAERGDSGAIVVDAQRRVIGMIAIGAGLNQEGDPPPKKYPTWACHILPVLDKLGICVATTGGLSYGSCSATDGSGTAPAKVAELEVPEGQVLFSHGVAGVREPKEGVERLPVTPAQQARLFALRDAVDETARGRELHETFGEVRREIGYLIRNSRAVKVAWHRGRGPAFLAHTLNHLKGDTDSIPLEIDGVSREQLLTRMARVLSEHGSNPLHDAIERYERELMPILSNATTVYECIELLRETDAQLKGELTTAGRQADP